MNVSKTINFSQRQLCFLLLLPDWVSKLNTNWVYLTIRGAYHRHFHAGKSALIARFDH